jgi:anion-transporting  ArsA/GET3 family ATPase
MSVTDRLFDTRVRFLSGKGGTGKSSVALALCLLAAQKGKRVLLCETNPAESLARFIGEKPLNGEPRKLAENLHAVALIPREAIREYALMILKFKALYNAVFENRLVQYFLRAVPSLGEYVMLGKLWFHETQREDGEPLYDLIVVDAPATGHLISWMRVPQVFTEMMPAGPLKKSAGDFLEMLHDPARAKLDIVTLPEEMPVNETIEMDHAVTQQRLITRGLTIINRVTPALGSDLLPKLKEVVSADSESLFRPLLEAVETREHWRTLGERYLKRLPADDLASAIRITRQEAPLSGLAAFEAIAKEIEGQL